MHGVCLRVHQSFCLSGCRSVCACTCEVESECVTFGCALVKSLTHVPVREWTSGSHLSTALRFFPLYLPPPLCVCVCMCVCMCVCVCVCADSDVQFGTELPFDFNVRELRGFLHVASKLFVCMFFLRSGQKFGGHLAAFRILSYENK